MPTRPTQLVPGGVNLFGYFRAESGVGEHARTMLAALDEAGIPVAPIDFEDARNRSQHGLPIGVREEPCFDVHLICVNADQTPHFVERFGAERLQGHRIGYWHWEVEEFPEWMARSAELVDEIWTASRHAADAIRRKVDKPVRAVPPAVDPPTPSPLPPGLLPAGEGPLLLTCFDFDSVVARKNPEGAVAAFRAAFPEPGRARLLVKSINGQHHRELHHQLRSAIGGRPDVIEFDGYLSRRQQASLISSCDLFLSLHRAEGFGLMLAEAMLAGKPVVATGYSGNLDFMDAETAFLVPFRLVPVASGSGPYSGIWAEPDLEAAAALIRMAVENPERSLALGCRARSAILAGHTPEVRAAQLAANLAEVRSRPHRPAARSREIDDLETKLHQLATGVDLGPARRLSQASLFDRALLRLLSPFWRHQQEVDKALLEIQALALTRREVEIAEIRSEYLLGLLAAEGRGRRELRRERRSAAGPRSTQAGQASATDPLELWAQADELD